MGTAGVGRKWIKGFAIIARPLTFLTQKSEREFFFDDEARKAQAELKKLVSTAPVLIKVNYDLAKPFSSLDKTPRPSDHGLLVVAMDSCSNGAGWILYQMIDKDKRPALFGSCTFSPAESRYSQPKCELYGVFRAVKDLRHRIWGVFFRLDVDAKFLKEMIQHPDLPNAPMTRWLLYLSLFDFQINHVPAISHQGPDGLSRRRQVPEDSDESDAEEFLDKFLGFASVRPSFPSTSFLNGPFVSASFQNLSLELRCLADPPLASFMTSGVVEDMGIFGSFPFLHCKMEISNWFAVDPAAFDPSICETAGNNYGSIFRHSLLKFTDEFSYTSFEFFHRKKPVFRTYTYLLGSEIFDLKVTEYRQSFLSDVKSGEQQPTDDFEFDPSLVQGCPTLHDHGWPSNPSYIGPPNVRTDTRWRYKEVVEDILSCASHRFGVKDREPPGFWEELKAYLIDNTALPDRCSDPAEFKAFVRRSKSFVVYQDLLWRLGKKGMNPRRVITDFIRRNELVADAHNCVGHRGRDATYKTLSERFYWPNMYDDVAWFVRSCTACQLRSKAKPVVPFSPTWTSAVLRRFDLDTVHMPDGKGGYKFLYQAMEPVTEWPEARAERVNNSERWAKFIYEDIICRFGCIPFF